MINNFKLPFNTNLLEVLTAIFFAAVGYGYLFKLSYYGAMGVPWFSGSLTTTFVFISSLNYIFCAFIGLAIAWMMTKYINEKYLLKLTGGMLIIVFLLGFFVISKYEILILYFGKYSIYLFWLFNVSLTAYYMLVFFHNKLIAQDLYGGANALKKFPLVLLLMISSSYFLVPLITGAAAARAVISNPDQTVNLVKLKNEKQEWYLIEFFNDKALIREKGSSNRFKIVESGEIEYFEDRSK